jgi:hypothetical protein
MPIITISRGSYSKGMAVAEKVAQRLGYECISREIILEAFEEFNVPEIKFIRAIHDAPSVLDRLSFEKDKFIGEIIPGTQTDIWASTYGTSHSFSICGWLTGYGT